MENNEVGDVSRTPIVPQSNQGKEAEKKDSSSTPSKDKKTEFETYWSPQLQMLTGAKNLHSLHMLLSKYEEELFKNTPLEKTVLGRALKVAGIDIPIAVFVETLQHELFGHAAKSKEFGRKSFFRISHPWDFRQYPWDIKKSWLGAKGSIHSSDESSFDSRFWDKEVKVAAGGMEADKVMADHILGKMHIAGKTDHNSNLGYLTAKWNRSAYVFKSNYAIDANELMWEFWSQYNWGPDWYNSIMQSLLYSFVKDKEGLQNDPRAYVRELYIKYIADPKYRQGWDYTGPDMKKLSSTLKTAAVWSALSPAALKAFGEEIRYISTGKKDFKMPKSFVDTDFDLGPECPEFYLNYFTRTVNNSPQKFYARHCPIGVEKSYGLGMKTFGKTGEKTSLTLGTDVWLQEKKLGGNLELELKRSLLKDFFLGLHAGYKTRGSLPGYPDKAGPYFGVGAEWRF